MRVDEEAAAAMLLARAFRDNPLNCAVVAGSEARRTRVNQYGMRTSLRASRERARRMVMRSRGGISKGSGDLNGVLIGFGPGAYPTPPPPISFQLWCLLGQGLRVMRHWGAVYRILSEMHIIEQHCYLALLGVRIDRQGRGIGANLLAAWLQEVDELALPSYLETDREENRVFYSRVGFEVIESVEVLGVPVWCMRRPAVGGARTG